MNPNDEPDADDRADRKLPETAELGDEGGSYGDGTMQAETFGGAEGNARVDPKRVGAPVESAPATQENNEGGTDDMVKHSSEPPQRSRR